MAAPGLVIPVQILTKSPGREWTWRAGPVRIGHEVIPRSSGGSEVRVKVSAPPVLEQIVGLTYGPFIRLLLANLVRVAGR